MQPKLGDIKVDVRPPTKDWPKWTVVVRKFKFDSIRQESYWVTIKVKSYTRYSDVMVFASRYN